MPEISFFNIFYFSMIFIIGCCIGSFINVIGLRLPKKESFTTNRSYCPQCKHQLAWSDLIPLLSFLFLRGRCRYCREKISFQYPAVELVTGFLFVCAYVLSIGLFNHANGAIKPELTYPLFLLYNLIFISIFIIIFITDLRFFVIPNKILFPLVILCLVCEPLWALISLKHIPIRFDLFAFEIQYLLKTLFRLDSFSYIFLPVIPALINPLVSAVFAFLFLFLINLFTHGKGMGMGDVKLAFVMGLFLGWPNIVWAFYIAFGLGAVVSLSMIFMKKRGFKERIPFGPFLVLGTFISYFIAGIH